MHTCPLCGNQQEAKFDNIIMNIHVCEDCAETYFSEKDDTAYHRVIEQLDKAIQLGK